MDTIGQEYNKLNFVVVFFYRETGFKIQYIVNQSHVVGIVFLFVLKLFRSIVFKIKKKTILVIILRYYANIEDIEISLVLRISSLRSHLINSIF